MLNKPYMNGIFRVVRSLISIDVILRDRFINVRMTNGMSTKKSNPIELINKICIGSDSSRTEAYPNTKMGNKSGLNPAEIIRAALIDRFL